MRQFMKLRILTAAIAVMAVAFIIATPSLASASIPRVPAGQDYIVYSVNYGGDALWYSSSAGKFESSFGSYTELDPTAGTGQEYVATNGLCATYDTGNYIYEKSCTGVASQKWRSTLQSDGYWTMTNNYLGTGDCVNISGTGVISMQACNGSLSQRWYWD